VVGKAGSGAGAEAGDKVVEVDAEAVEVEAEAVGVAAEAAEVVAEAVVGLVLDRASALVDYTED